MRCMLPLVAVTMVVTCHLSTFSQTTAAPNSDPVYQELRRGALSSEAYAVKDLVLKRDAAEFTFRSGVFYFFAPVNGRTTGAVFVGSGELALKPPLPSEAIALSRLTKQPQFVERFETLVLRFTDNTAVR